MGVPERHDLRVGDSERQAVVDELRVHLGAGRLTIEEFEDRTGVALSARTVAELQVVTADLPVVRASLKGPPVRARQPPQRSTWDKALRIHAGLWLLFSMFLVVIWAVVGGPFAWVMVVSAAVGLTVGIHAVVKGVVEG